jgi:hypothetical protein
MFGQGVCDVLVLLQFFLYHLLNAPRTFNQREVLTTLNSKVNLCQNVLRNHVDLSPECHFDQ